MTSRGPAEYAPLSTPGLILFLQTPAILPDLRRKVASARRLGINRSEAVKDAPNQTCSIRTKHVLLSSTAAFDQRRRTTDERLVAGSRDTPRLHNPSAIHRRRCCRCSCRSPPWPPGPSGCRCSSCTCPKPRFGDISACATSRCCFPRKRRRIGWTRYCSAASKLEGDTVAPSLRYVQSAESQGTFPCFVLSGSTMD